MTPPQSNAPTLRWLIAPAIVLGLLLVLCGGVFSACRLPKAGTLQGVVVKHPFLNEVWGIRVRKPFCPVERIVQLAEFNAPPLREGALVSESYEITDVIQTGWNWSVVVRLHPRQ